jgi:O-antigen ligase
MFGDHPWVGIGIGNYSVRYPEYELPHWYEPLGHAHNVFINFLAETGFLGAAAFTVFWLGIPWLAWRTAARSSGGTVGRPQQAQMETFYIRALAVGVAGTWTFVTVHSLFDNLFVQHIQLQLALLMVALVAAGNMSARDGVVER